MQKKSAVIHFIDEERAKGTDDKQIRHKLLDAGWQMDIIQHAMHAKHRDEPPLVSEPRGSLRNNLKSGLSKLPFQNSYLWLVVFVVLIGLALFV